MTAQTSAPIRVVVVDDQPLIRTGLATMIGTEADITLVGEAADGVAGLARVRRHRPDVLLTDMRMPERDGLALLADVTGDPELAGVRVVVLTTFELDEYVFEALAHGASGFLLKDAEPAELLAAIRAVAAGGSLLAPSVTRRVIEEFAGGSRGRRVHPGLKHLTAREREILGLVAQGLSNTEIAEQLVLSADTVRTHVSRTMVKLQARDRAQLVVFAVQSGL